MAFCKNWKFWSLCTSVRGNKHCRITLPDNGPIKITLRDCFCPYDASRYAQTDSKMNLDIALDEENVKMFEAIDEWVIDKLAQDPMQYFKQKLSRDKIKLLFKNRCVNIKRMIKFLVRRFVARSWKLARIRLDVGTKTKRKYPTQKSGKII